MEVLKVFESESTRVAEMCTSKPGKRHKVVCVDKLNGESFIYSWFTTTEKALESARKATREATGLASRAPVATVYYAYDPDGSYIGVGVWRGEWHGKVRKT